MRAAPQGKWRRAAKWCMFVTSLFFGWEPEASHVVHITIYIRVTKEAKVAQDSKLAFQIFFPAWKESAMLYKNLLKHGSVILLCLSHCTVLAAVMTMSLKAFNSFIKSMGFSWPALWEIRGGVSWFITWFFLNQKGSQILGFSHFPCFFSLFCAFHSFFSCTLLWFPRICQILRLYAPVFMAGYREQGFQYPSWS